MWLGIQESEGVLGVSIVMAGMQERGGRESGGRATFISRARGVTKTYHNNRDKQEDVMRVQKTIWLPDLDWNGHTRTET